ncbi:MAG: Transcriptional regulator, XRE family [Candidatus Levybacteria bacterium GW2011_GWC1_40_19]|nr:MAG: Transcriptional regulator, XRE family [Candidatus Levybacteria bacterium GW2011_GWA1_39_34]KKR50385.1 MAG: Transcriptional regulator, XRE family [Candidatus Levybacteria bacterium GW2011_GWC1_40_19]OGH21007.1 MAG: hypothetical protein A2695_02365 [Candidatus Levybacteria bacterium RIFCSPHIGHO2_01_FULL_40_83]OGH26580.1 MAG: hypothetical protein A3D82_03530 [Candidatus Levybacteria bacterium RIFCSPHIGHO2_02_FULL_40_29]OGH32310.1 MAG: hypothetical protein A3E70_02910 [Candidatus Levybacter
MRKKELEALGQRVKKMRKPKKLSQVDLAVAIGLSPSYIGAIEQGTRRPSLKTLKKLAKILGVKSSDLLPF